MSVEPEALSGIIKNRTDLLDDSFRNSSFDVLGAVCIADEG
jgi:hypothetical protein